MALVAMTREMGSLGKDVATQLAQALGTTVIQHEIIDLLADKMRVRKSHVVRLLDGHAGILERLTADKTSLSIYTADETYQLALRPEGAVIRGWGATHLLRSVPHAVCVRVCAPAEVRVKRMKERLNTDDEEFVGNEIRLSDEAHGAIMRRHFGINWQEPEHYDLTLNTERVGIAECADQILRMTADPAFAETVQSRGRLRNLSLAAHVRAALRADSRTRNLRLGIDADGGKVTLSGIALPGEDARIAAEVAESVPGVREVVDAVRSADSARPTKEG